MSRTDEKALFGIANTAKRWEVTKDTVRRLIKTGKLHAVRIGGRVLVPLAEIERAEKLGVGE